MYKIRSEHIFKPYRPLPLLIYVVRNGYGAIRRDWRGTGAFYSLAKYRDQKILHHTVFIPCTNRILHRSRLSVWYFKRRHVLVPLELSNHIWKARRLHPVLGKIWNSETHEILEEMELGTKKPLRRGLSVWFCGDHGEFPTIRCSIGEEYFYMSYTVLIERDMLLTI